MNDRDQNSPSFHIESDHVYPNIDSWNLVGQAADIASSHDSSESGDEEDILEFDDVDEEMEAADTRGHRDSFSASRHLIVP